MLQLDPDPTFAWPVKFNTPKGEKTINLVFKHMTVEDSTAWWEAAAKRAVAFEQALGKHLELVTKAAETASKAGQPAPVHPPAPKPEKSGLDEIMDVVVGWEDVDAPFSRDAMAKLLANYHDLSASKICGAWRDGLAGRRLEN